MAESDLNHPGRGRPASAVRFRGRLRRFLRTTRAGATAIVALGVSTITLGASALIVDHNWLVDQRDVLKNASDAAAIAATVELERQRGGTLTQAQLEQLITDVASTYTRLNLQFLSGSRLAQAEQSLTIQTTPHATSNRVDLSVTADLGGTLLARHLPLTAHYSGPTFIGTFAAAELLISPIEIVLALDVSSSMELTLDGRTPHTGQQNRLDIVKAAALDLVDSLNPNPQDRIAVSVLPWHGAVRLRSGHMNRWVSRGWAEYPDTRHYPAIYRCRPRSSCTYTSEDQDLPTTPTEAWAGCLDEHRVSAVGHASHADPSDWFTSPQTLPFAQALYPGRLGAAYVCLVPPLPFDMDNRYSQYCYSSGSRFIVPQPSCRDRPPQTIPRTLPLSSDRLRVERAINGLEAVGASTHSALGVLWGQRLLDRDWHSVWNDPIHPVDPDDPANRGTRKAIVLLTDGQDTRCGSWDPNCETNNVGIPRGPACTAVKARGTEIFVVAAIDNPPATLVDGLIACSSQADRPGGTYTFLDHADAQSLRATFTAIADQLRVVRRIH